jgi:hypothetical protein
MRWPLSWPSWPEFLVGNPWIVDVIEWLRVGKSLWDQYNSIIILVGLWVVARKLRDERERIEERVDTLSQHVKAAAEASDAAIAAAREAADAIMAAISESRSGRATANGALVAPSAMPQLQPSDYANWDQVNKIWSEIKERIELKVQDIPQQKVRTKYSRMPRRTYHNIINALRNDGLLKPVHVVLKLLELDHEYQVLRFKPKDVATKDVAKFVEALQIVNGTRALPPLPSGPADEPDPESSAAAIQTGSNATPNGEVSALEPIAVRTAS